MSFNSNTLDWSLRRRRKHIVVDHRVVSMQRVLPRAGGSERLDLGQCGECSRDSFVKHIYGMFRSLDCSRVAALSLHSTTNNAWLFYTNVHSIITNWHILNVKWDLNIRLWWSWYFIQQLQIRLAIYSVDSQWLSNMSYKIVPQCAFYSNTYCW